MEQSDLAPYRYDLPEPIPNVFAVGWIESQAYSKGTVSVEFIDKLSDLIMRELVNRMRGIHWCSLCGESESWLIRDDDKKILGSAEVWVPEAEGPRVFAAPNLIYHYVRDHFYRPPDEFVSAVLEFDVESNWSGEEYLRKAAEKLFR